MNCHAAPSIFQTQTKSKWILGRLGSGDEAKLCRHDASLRAVCRSSQNKKIVKAFRLDAQKRKRAYKASQEQAASFAHKAQEVNRPASRQIRAALAQQKHDKKLQDRRDREELQELESTSWRQRTPPTIRLNTPLLASPSAGTTLVPLAKPSPQQSTVGWSLSKPAVHNLLSPGVGSKSPGKRPHNLYPQSLPSTAIHSSPKRAGRVLPADRASTTPLRNKPKESGASKSPPVSPSEWPTPGVTEALSKIDSGPFVVDHANPVRDKHTGAIQTFDQVFVETQQVLTRLNGFSKPLRQMMLNIPGQEVSTRATEMIDLSAIEAATGFEKDFLDALARDFMSVVHCRIDLLLKSDDNGSLPKMDWPQFKQCLRKRLMCCELLQHRIFEICDSDKSHTVSFRQLCIGLTVFQPNPLLKTRLDDTDSQAGSFTDTCTRFMDASQGGIVTKLSMLTVCDTAFERETSYLLADALWEVLSCMGGEMSTEQFTNKLENSRLLRVIFSKLMLLQGLPPPPEDYEERKIRKGPIYVHELNMSTKREVLELCHQWMQDKSRGQFYYLDQLVHPFKTATLQLGSSSEGKRRRKSKSNEDCCPAELSMREILQKATEFQGTRRGNGHMQAGHYCKVMLGLQAKGLPFLDAEIQRIEKLNHWHATGERLLSERQVFKFEHYLHIIRLFINPPKVKTKDKRRRGSAAVKARVQAMMFSRKMAA